MFGSVAVFGRGRVDVLDAEPTSAGFGRYREALEQRHVATGREVYLVLDNGACHTSKASQQALAERATWLHPLWLARSCPQLNKKEREWRTLKRDVRSHLAHSLREFADEVLSGLVQLGGERVDSVDHVPD